MIGRARDIVTLQRRDHAKMERLLTRYERGSTAVKQRAYADIVELVTKHAFAEETVLFPAARRLLGETGQQVTGDIENKHQRVNELMAELEAGEPGDESFEKATRELFPLLRADAREEEDVLLVALSEKAEIEALRQLGTAWMAARATAPNRPHPKIPRRPPGNLLAGLPLAITDRIRKAFARRQKGIA